MKRNKLIFLVTLIAFLPLIYFQGGEFFAQILGSGNYLLSPVSKQNSLEKYVPPDLRDLSEVGAPGQHIRKIAYDNLRDLVSDMESAGVPVKVISAYRSYGRQKFIFSFWSKRSRDAARFSAQAGHSEHQLGTTVDFGVGDIRIDLKEAFADTPQGKWLEENAWKYGFVMSYPRDKEETTGYIYEPWHFRFIGLEEAKEWRSLGGFTLGEYFLLKPQYYRLVRLYYDYRVYAIDSNGIKHWIETARTFRELGYEWRDIVVVNKEEFDLYPEGNSIIGK